MAKKQFKAESKRLLDLMINSIYTNKEIFIRELISNASDATDKRYYENAQAGGEALNRDELPIHITIDKKSRTLTIADNGAGMTEKDLESNLGTIAKSGSLEFKENMEKNEDVDIIGQFGVGFYSAFMVADEIEVISRAMGSEDSYRWASKGNDGFTIEKAEKDSIGTTINLKIKEKSDQHDYDQYLEDYYIISLIKKHSDYIRYPITMEVEKTIPAEEEGAEPLTYRETETLNSMTPIWKKRKSEATQEEYNEFYKDKFMEYADPLKTIYTSTEGVATYNALLFIPATVPFNYHSKEYKKGLQLYASGVLIMEHAPDLLPDYFAFVKGIVDSQDLSLNISREMLQQDAQLKVIAGHLEKKIKSELELMLKNSREDYIKMWDNFGVSIKYGIYESYGMKKELLQDLVIFDSSAGEKSTLQEYVDRMGEDQKYIYYVASGSVEQAQTLPAVKTVLDKGYEILYFTNEIDEFTIKIMQKYADKEFRSVTGGDLGIETTEEKKELEKQAESSKELIDFIKENLGDKVTEVELSTISGDYPAVITAKGEISLEMERTLSKMPGNNMPMRAEKVLQINPDNAVFAKMENLLNTDKDKLNHYATVLYNQALLLEGLEVDDITKYTNAVNEILK